MITPCDRSSRNRLLLFLPLALAWLVAGVVSSAWQGLLSADSNQNERCATGLCLRLPEAAAPVASWKSPFDFATTARGDEPGGTVESREKAGKEGDQQEQGEQADGFVPLFDGKSLEGWKESDFAGQGTVEVADEEIRLGFGQDLTGITWDGDELPTTNYEIELEAKRVDGADFFCGLTFPVDENTCSLIVGGWGGTIVGLSSIDRFDASMNETTKFMTFKRDQWYKIRVRVTPEKIEAWIDDGQVVDFEIKKHKLSVRVEVQASKPLGIASWQTSAALRNLRLRRLDEKGDGAQPPAEQATPRE